MKRIISVLTLLIAATFGASVANATTIPSSLYSVTQSNTVLLGNVPISADDYYYGSVENGGTLWETSITSPTANSVQFYADMDCTDSTCVTGYHLLPIGSMASDEYMAITGNASGDYVKYTFSETQSSVSFNWGSVEADNGIRLTMTNGAGDNQIVSITGQDILDANSSLTAGASNTYVTISALTDYLITSISFVIGDALSVFEVSDLSGVPASVPLPGALVLFGPAVVGLGLLSRKKKEKTA